MLEMSFEDLVFLDVFAPGKVKNSHCSVRLRGIGMLFLIIVDFPLHHRKPDRMLFGRSRGACAFCEVFAVGGIGAL